MVFVELCHPEGPAYHIGMIEPVIRGQFRLSHALQHMLGKRHEIAPVGAVERDQGHGILGGKAHGLIIHFGDAVNMICPFLYKSVLSHALKDVIHHSGVSNHRAAQAQRCVDHVIRSHRLPVGPHRRLVNVYEKVSLILRRYAVRQHSLKLHIGIQLHQREEHQACGIFIDLHPVHEKGV